MIQRNSLYLLTSALSKHSPPAQITPDHPPSSSPIRSSRLPRLRVCREERQHEISRCRTPAQSEKTRDSRASQQQHTFTDLNQRFPLLLLTQTRPVQEIMYMLTHLPAAAQVGGGGVLTLCMRVREKALSLSLSPSLPLSPPPPPPPPPRSEEHPSDLQSP